jgi:hypothetical protein
MNDAIRCPGCEVQLLLPVLPDGQTVACPRCQRVFEPAAQRTNPVPVPVQRPRAPTPVDEPGDDPTLLPRHGRPELPRGGWRGCLAIALLAVSGLAFALHAYGEIELILLNHAQEELGPPRPVRGNLLRDLKMKAVGMQRRPAPLPNPRQAMLDERWERWEKFAPKANSLVHVAFWPALLCLFVWLHRAHKNLPGLKAQGLSFTPAWAFIAFVVPIFNIVVPFTFIQEIWRASHPHAVDTPQAWRKSPFARSVRIWWLFYAGAIVCWLGAFFTTPSFPESYDQLLPSAWFGAAASFCSGAACVLLIHIIRRITQRQQQRYGNL